MLGQIAEVLVEGRREGEDNLLAGFAGNYVRVLVTDVTDEFAGRIVRVKLTDMEDDYMIGELDE
jgi:tRNA A37 methylthiotransferase MiaB